MRDFRSTIATTVVVAVVAGFTLWDYRKAQQEGSVAEGERAAIDYSPEQARELKIQRPTETIHLQKDDKGVWRMTEPAEDLGEVAAVEGFIFQLLAARLRVFSEDGAKPSSTEDWGKYGLNPPAATIEVNGERGPQSLQISSKNAFDGSFFVRHRDDLMMGDAGLIQLRDKPSTAFRSRHVWREGDKPVTKVEIRAGAENFVLVNKDSKWNVMPDPGFKMDTDKIESWIEQIRQFTPADFARESLDENSKREFLLLKPSAVLTVNDDWQLSFGQDRDGDVFLYTNKRGTVYKTTVAAANAFRVGADYFRDAKAPFQIEVEKVRQAELRVGKKTLTVKRDDPHWGELAEVFTKLKGMEAREFLSVPGKTGIGSPQIVLRGEKGEELFALAWGDEYKARRPHNNQASLRYVKSSLTKEIVGVAKEKVDNLIDPKLEKK